MSDGLWDTIIGSIPKEVSNRLEPLRIIVHDLLPIGTIQEAYGILSDTNWRLFFLQMIALGNVLMATAILPIIVYAISEKAIGNVSGPINLLFSAITVLVIAGMGLFVFAHVVSEPLEMMVERESIGRMDTWKKKIGALFLFIMGMVLFYYGMVIFTVISVNKFTFGTTLIDRIINLGLSLVIILLQTGTILTGLGMMLIWIAPPSDRVVFKRGCLTCV